MQLAWDHSPEVFGRVIMLYVDMEVGPWFKQLLKTDVPVLRACHASVLDTFLDTREVHRLLWIGRHSTSACGAGLSRVHRRAVHARVPMRDALFVGNGARIRLQSQCSAVCEVANGFRRQLTDRGGVTAAGRVIVSRLDTQRCTCPAMLSSACCCRSTA